MKARPNITPNTSISKIVAILLFLTIPLVGIYLVTYGLRWQNGGNTVVFVDTQPLPSYTTEVTDIDSQDNPELGLAGYSSGALQIGNRIVNMRMLAPNRKKVILSSFPCETRPVTAVGGDFKIFAFNDVSDNDYINKFELGYQEFVIDPPTIEQTGLFSKRIVLSKSPKYEAFTLAFRRSCFDTEVYFYTSNPVKNKIDQLTFQNTDGSIATSIMIPKGTGIPQIDSSGNIISSTYNPTTKMRDKTRYAFDINSFGFIAVESYSQPQ